MADKSSTKSTTAQASAPVATSVVDTGMSHNWQLRMQRNPQSLPLEYPAMAPEHKNVTTSLFKNHNQGGFFSIMYAIGQRPLDNWEKQVRQGHVKRVTDTDIRSLAIEVMGPTPGTTFITSPCSPAQVLGVRLPVLNIVAKNMKRHFGFEVQIFDDTGIKRRFFWSNMTTATKVGPFFTQMPIRMEEGWNQLTVNLADLTRKVYGTGYLETNRVQVYSNCRIRRIYFCDAASAAGADEDIPADFKAFVLSAAGMEQTPSEAKMGASGVPNKMSPY